MTAATSPSGGSTCASLSWWSNTGGTVCVGAPSSREWLHWCSIAPGWRSHPRRAVPCPARSCVLRWMAVFATPAGSPVQRIARSARLPRVTSLCDRGRWPAGIVPVASAMPAPRRIPGPAGTTACRWFARAADSVRQARCCSSGARFLPYPHGAPMRCRQAIIRQLVEARQGNLHALLQARHRIQRQVHIVRARRSACGEQGMYLPGQLLALLSAQVEIIE